MSKPSPFEAVLDVLAGRRRFEFDINASTVLHLLLGGDVDAVIDDRYFIAHVGVRKPATNRYFATLAPAVVGELMARAAIERVSSPVVIGLPASERTSPPWAHGPKLVWLVPEPTRLIIAIRTSTEAWSKPFVTAMPDDGPLRLPVLPDVETLPKAHLEFDPPRACPQCGVASARFRDLGAALVCGACGRSFERAALDPPAG